MEPGVEKVRTMKVTIEDIEINAAYIQLIYEYFQILDLPSDATGKVISAPEFV